MKSEALESEQVLVLTNGRGEFYAIPRDTLERFRVTGLEQARLQEIIGDDVLGYTLDHRYTRESVTAQFQAERRLEAAQRRLREQSGEGHDEDAHDVTNPGAASVLSESVEASVVFTGTILTLPGKEPSQLA